MTTDTCACGIARDDCPYRRPEARTHWDKAAHFICSADCRLGIADVVNGYIVSTVGDYRPKHLGGEVRETIGYRRFFETMVFRDSGRRCTEKDCPCGNVPEPSDWTEIDFEGYQTEAEARTGHARMIEKYRAIGGAS
jgi:hypothetical protein